MKTNNYKIRVILEPELQEVAALWPAAKRFAAAEKFARWAHQLRISAKIIASDARSADCRPPSLPKLARRKAVLN